MGLIPVCVKFAVYDAILGLLPGALVQFGVHGTIFRNASMARPGGRRLDQVIDEQDRRMGNEAFGLAPYNGRLVEWFSHHVILGLYVFLIAMPLTAFVIGCAIVLRSWSSDAGFRQATLESFTMVRAHLAGVAANRGSRKCEPKDHVVDNPRIKARWVVSVDPPR